MGAPKPKRLLSVRAQTSAMLDTFTALRQEEEKKHGAFVTKLAILDRLKALEEAEATGTAYVSPLGPPRVHAWTCEACRFARERGTPPVLCYAHCAHPRRPAPVEGPRRVKVKTKHTEHPALLCTPRGDYRLSRFDWAEVDLTGAEISQLADDCWLEIEEVHP
jgi:hypothetical protein